MNPNFRADLHCHSNFSDGTDTPQQLIELAQQKGLSGLAITDHDTIAAYEQGLKLAQEKNFLLLCGVEFSASHRGEPVHVLGYAYDLKSEAISSLCQRHKMRRKDRNQKILDRLKNLGIVIDADELEASGPCIGSLGRPHIASILLKRQIVGSIQEAFERYLGEGKSAYVSGEPISVEETIDVIHQGRGKAILAHPHLLSRSTTIRNVLQMPFDGLECYYAKMPLAQEQRWIDIANQRKWLITGGSDYHGTTKPQNALGSSWVGEETFFFLYNHFSSINK